MLAVLQVTPHSPAVQHLLSEPSLPHKHMFKCHPLDSSTSASASASAPSLHLLKTDVSTDPVIVDSSQVFLLLLKDFNVPWIPAAACQQMSDINGKTCSWIKVRIFLSVFLLPKLSSYPSRKQLPQSHFTKQSSEL